MEERIGCWNICCVLAGIRLYAIKSIPSKGQGLVATSSTHKSDAIIYEARVFKALGMNSIFRLWKLYYRLNEKFGPVPTVLYIMSIESTTAISLVFPGRS